ncbi:MAG: aminotransferase class IV [Actinobacteria bacterium]|nr:aminotransferase class IV [Actinomycetota bacterium]
MQAFVNGDFVPLEEAKVSARDRGFTIGEGVFEVWRTYDAKPVEEILRRHRQRLAKSLRYIEVDPDPVIAVAETVWPELIERNRAEIEAAGDMWVLSIVTGGVGEEGGARGEPTIVFMPKPLPYGQGFFAEGRLYDVGARLVPSLMNENPFYPSDPRVKSISRMSNTRSERKQVREGAATWAITFDRNGAISEATGAGLGIEEEGRLVVPPKWTRLESVSMQISLKIAGELGIEIEERPLTVYDFVNADAAYLFGTSIAIAPVAELDGIKLAMRRDVGDRILKGWIDFVEFDFVEQCRRLDS